MIMSSPIEDKEEEEGCDAISTQDSGSVSGGLTNAHRVLYSPSLRKRCGTPADCAMCSRFCGGCVLRGSDEALGEDIVSSYIAGMMMVS